MKFASIFAALAACAIAMAASASADTQQTTSRGAVDNATYCIAQGGAVQERIPEFGTNNPNPLKLSGSVYFCQFTKKDTSQINVLLSTLGTTQPTLAALAYYAKVQLGSCNGNPASCYCTLLGGSDSFGGINLDGGGWVLKSDPTDVLETCIFPDMSSIDSWGLAYHSAGIIRGKNLTGVLKYANPHKTVRSFIPHKNNGFPFQ
jgi:putative hemolysin